MARTMPIRPRNRPIPYEGPKTDAIRWLLSNSEIRVLPRPNSQRKAALEAIHKAERPLLFVYIHGWQNNAVSSDVCRFEHFLDTVSIVLEFTGRKINVIGVYVALRGQDLTAPGLKFLTVWNRKGA